jgi:hypothetical protein
MLGTRRHLLLALLAAPLPTTASATAHDGMHLAVMPGVTIAADDVWQSAPTDRPPQGRQDRRPPREMAAAEPLPPSRVEIEVRGDRRYISANGVPNHATGAFPGRGNPHAITAQRYEFSIPVAPTVGARRTPVGMGMFGVAINGVFFEAGTAEWWRNDRRSGWHIEGIGPRGRTLGIDASNGHVQPNGGYHYHAVPTGLVTTLVGDEKPSGPTLIGWAADGFPIYAPWGYDDPVDATSAVRTLRSSWRLKDGERPNGPGGRFDGTYEEDFEFVEGHGDLDESNGRFGVTPEFPEGTYHYVITDEFPFIGRSWKGEPSSGMRKPGGGAGGGPGGPGQRPGRGPQGGRPGRPPRGGPGAPPPPGPPR